MIFFFSEGTKRQAKRKGVFKKVIFFLSVFKTSLFVCWVKKLYVMCHPKLCRTALNLGIATVKISRRTLKTN